MATQQPRKGGKALQNLRRRRPVDLAPTRRPCLVGHQHKTFATPNHLSQNLESNNTRTIGTRQNGTHSCGLSFSRPRTRRWRSSTGKRHAHSLSLEERLSIMRNLKLEKRRISRSFLPPEGPAGLSCRLWCSTIACYRRGTQTASARCKQNAAKHKMQLQEGRADEGDEGGSL